MPGGMVRIDTAMIVGGWGLEFYFGVLQKGVLEVDSDVILHVNLGGSLTTLAKSSLDWLHSHFPLAAVTYSCQSSSALPSPNVPNLFLRPTTTTQD